MSSSHAWTRASKRPARSSAPGSTPTGSGAPPRPSATASTSSRRRWSMSAPSSRTWRSSSSSARPDMRSSNGFARASPPIASSSSMPSEGTWQHRRRLRTGAVRRAGRGLVTVNPLLGGDSMRPFLERDGRGVFLVARSSNPGASRSPRCAARGRPAGEHAHRGDGDAPRPGRRGRLRGGRHRSERGRHDPPGGAGRAAAAPRCWSSGRIARGLRQRRPRRPACGHRRRGEPRDRGGAGGSG